MKIDSSDWRRYLIQGAGQLGIDLDDAMASRLGLFALELLRWNQRINLTSIVDSREIAVKHIIDSLAPADLLPRNAQLLDIGSGAGLPGILLKIYRPDLTLVSIEAVRKKCSFQQHVVRQLALPQVQVIHARAEKAARDSRFGGCFDVVVCRALAELDRFVALAEPFLKPQGVMIAMKGPKNDIATAPAWQAARSDYHLPYIQDQRALVVLQRMAGVSG